MTSELKVNKEDSINEVEHVISCLQPYDEIIDSFSAEEQKKLIRRIDYRLVVVLGTLYCVSLMDRTNIGIATIAGMTYDLDLVGSRYSIIVLVFFFTYIICQPPATVILRKIGPRLFLPTTCLLWGITVMCFGFVSNWTQMVGLRVVLGVLEAGYFPGCAYLLSCWYPRFDLQKRNALFYMIGSIASAFAGILGYAFSMAKDHGTGPVAWGQHYGPTTTNPTAPSGINPGIAGWRWIFIIQGALTCALSIPAYLFIVDFPELATNTFGLKFLNQREVDFVVARIEKDRNDVHPEEFNFISYLKSGLDLKVWGFAALFGLITTVTYAIAYFLPIILNEGMGFGVAASQCLTAPPYIANSLYLYVTAWLSDKYRLRSPIILFNGCMMLIGLPLLGYVQNVGVSYFGAFIVIVAGNSSLPCILTWQANNIRGQWKRAFCSATLVGAGGIGGIIGSTVYRSQDAPNYRPGIITGMLASALIVLVTLALNLKFYRANKRADGGGKVIEGLEGFRYTY